MAAPSGALTEGIVFLEGKRMRHRSFHLCGGCLDPNSPLFAVSAASCILGRSGPRGLRKKGVITAALGLLAYSTI